MNARSFAFAASVRHAYKNRVAALSQVEHDLKKLNREGTFNTRHFVRQFGQATYDKFLASEVTRRMSVIRQSLDEDIANTTKTRRRLHLKHFEVHA